MSFSMNGTFVLLGLIPLAGLVIAVGMTPRWFIRSLSKHALWRLRDDVVDDVITGKLDREHPSVKELISRVEWAIEESRSFDLLHLLVWRRAWRQLPPGQLRKLARVPDLHGLSDEQAERIKGYRRRYDSVAIGALFLSSWLGLAIVCRVAIPHMLRTSVSRIRWVRVRAIFRQATDEVVSGTPIGHAAQDYVMIKRPALERLPEPAVA